MALVARGGSVLGHLRFEWILVARAETGPVAGLVLEAIGVLDRGLQACELALEVAIAAGDICAPTLLSSLIRTVPSRYLPVFSYSAKLSGSM